MDPVSSAQPLKASFSALDYSLFGISLTVSLFVGVGYAYLGSKKAQTTKEVLFAGGKLGIFPAAVTLAATFVSSISLLGFPSEIYVNGVMICYVAVAYFIAYPTAAYLFLPLFYKLQLPSAYEYLSLRFNLFVRRSASLIFCFQTILYLSVGLYAPALALNAVTDLPLAVSILFTGFVCIVYTSIGGAKTVVWTNVWQFGLIIFGLVAIIISGSRYVGGFSTVFEVAREGGRLDFGDFRIDPRVRHSFWSVSIGTIFMLLALFAANQMSIQRYVSMKSLKEAQIALFLNAPMHFSLLILYVFVGLIIYASFYGCDPIKSGLVQKSAEILPYFVMNHLSYGVPGLFVSALYGAGLGTVSVGLHALSTAVLEDFVKPAYRSLAQRSLDDDDSKVAKISKIISFAFGLFIVSLAYIFSFLKIPILQIALTIFGVGDGPILGVFCLGIFFKRPDGKSAAIGLLTSALVTSWIGFGPLVYNMNPGSLPLSTEKCPGNINDTSSFMIYDNFSTVFSQNFSQKIDNSTQKFDIYAQKVDISTKKVDTSNNDSFSFFDIYRISYQYYSLIGFLIVIIVGYLVSFLTNWNGTNENFDPNLHISFKNFWVTRNYRLPLAKNVVGNAKSSKTVILYHRDSTKNTDFDDSGTVSWKTSGNE